MGALAWLGALSSLSACDPKTPEKAITKSRAELIAELDPEGYRVLNVGNTALYMPMSWLIMSGTLPEQRSGKGDSGVRPFVEPAFRNVEPNNTPHRLIRDQALFGQGFSFLVLERPPPRRAPQGVSPLSAVYKISFEYRVEGDHPASGKLVSEINNAPVVEGWAARQDTLYDVSKEVAFGTDLFSLFVAHPPTSFNADRARFRYDRDLVVTIEWVRRGHNNVSFDSAWVRSTQQSVSNLIDWLRTPPQERDPAKIFELGYSPD